MNAYKTQADYDIGLPTYLITKFGFIWYILRPCQHNNWYIDGRSQI